MMDKLRELVITALAIALTSSVYALPDRVGDFALLDSDGSFHQLSRYRNREALVLMSFDSSCSSIATAISQLRSLQMDWSDQGVAFAFLESSGEADIETIRTTKAEYGLDLPLLIDNGQLVTETLSLSRAGEVAILDPERLTLIYRGSALESADQSLAREIA